MKLNRKIIAGFIAASAVMFGVAHAQGPGCGPDGMPGMKGGMQRGGMMEPGVRAEQRLTRLKGDLKLTAPREPLWQAYADKVKAEAASPWSLSDLADLRAPSSAPHTCFGLKTPRLGSAGLS